MRLGPTMHFARDLDGMCRNIVMHTTIALSTEMIVMHVLFNNSVYANTVLKVLAAFLSSKHIPVQDLECSYAT